MTQLKRWTVEIFIDEHSDARRTHAEARLITSDRTGLRASGVAHRNPHDPEVPEVGDELAAARALAALADELRAVAAADVAAIAENASHGW